MTEQKNTATVMIKDAQSRDDEETKVAAASNVSAAAATANSSSQAAPTLRDAFQVPEKASDEGDDHWQAFQDKLKQEAKGIKWTAAMPDLGAKICELLDIKIHDILMTAWKKAEALRQALEDSKVDPERSIYLDLAEHSIDYETKPFIDVKIKGASVKKITLTVMLNLKLKGFTLKVQNGAICEIQTGSCEGKGAIKYEKLPIAEKKLSPIKLPLMIKVPNLFSTTEAADKDDAAETKAKDGVSSGVLSPNADAVPEQPDMQKPADPLERIEL
ncbi:MAG TPA: hypothetical protein VNG71_05545 [Pyrinomonadaceae bacterium]|nr:hypothetical protein [Pyrinomonadaceae bacterium]